MSGVSSINIKLAEAFGLKTDRLQSFTLKVEPNSLPTITAIYLPIGYGGATLDAVTERVTGIREITRMVSEKT